MGWKTTKTYDLKYYIYAHTESVSYSNLSQLFFGVVKLFKNRRILFLKMNNSISPFNNNAHLIVASFRFRRFYVHTHDSNFTRHRAFQPPRTFLENAPRSQPVVCVQHKHSTSSTRSSQSLLVCARPANHPLDAESL